MLQIPRLLLAAPESGSGKTMVTAGLLAALRNRGLRVQPFKAGPDYIDPGYHTLAAGSPCRNLDLWMLGEDAVRQSFSRNAVGADLALIEGVMGLFDGFGSGEENGSTADLARLLQAPVLLIVDARGMARSAAALVKGFHTFSPGVSLSGVILNRIGSERHALLCSSAIEAETGVQVLGYLPHEEALQLPERHLGLVPTAEEGPWQSFLERVAATVCRTVDLDRLLSLARNAPALPAPPALYERRPVPGNAPAARPLRLALAQDAAFSFTYPENVELLMETGAEIIPFSPLADSSLPEGTAGVIISGGFPELYADRLSANKAMLAALAAAHRRGTPVYAECGGLMYLTRFIQDGEGRRWLMAGLLPGYSVMGERVTLGYRLVEATVDGPLLAGGERVRGHEFHYSRWEGRPASLPAAYQLLPPDGSAGEPVPAGARLGNLWASYIHIHYLARPSMASRFVGWCRQALQERVS